MAAAGPKISPAAVGGLARLLIGGGALVYGATNSLFNVEGGHRAIVFNRLIGIKDEVGAWGLQDSSCMAVAAAAAAATVVAAGAPHQESIHVTALL